MTRHPLVARETEDVSELLQAMRMTGVRRVPVVDGRGALTGVIAIDDAFDIITTFSRHHLLDQKRATHRAAHAGRMKSWNNSRKELTAFATASSSRYRLG